MQASKLAHRMTPLQKLYRLGRRTRALLVAAPMLAMLSAVPLPAYASDHPQPPWHIESFCHRGAPAARRCLIRARQGIIVFQLAELASTPTIKWTDGMAVLAIGKDDRTRQMRFFAPPQKLSVPFTQVRAYDTGQQLVAFYADGRVHVRAMFAADHDRAVLVLPANIGADTLRLRFEGRNLHASWRNSQGQAQEQTVTARG
jgi:hypothetical protein